MAAQGTRWSTVTKLATARRWLVRVLIGLGAVLAASGLYLFVAYEPGAWAWPGYVDQSHVPTAVALARAVHRTTALASIPVALVGGVLLVAEAAVRWEGPLRRRSGVLIGPALVVFVLASLATGFLLPWDQLALKEVTVGSAASDFGGYREILWGDRIRLVLIGGSEMSIGAVRALLLLHALVIPGLLGWALWSGRDRQDVVIAATPGEGAH